MAKPDYILKIKPRAPDTYAEKVGVGWMNEKGGCSIKLDLGVVLHWQDFVPGGDYILMLWPATEKDNEE